MFLIHMRFNIRMQSMILMQIKFYPLKVPHIWSMLICVIAFSLVASGNNVQEGTVHGFWNSIIKFISNKAFAMLFYSNPVVLEICSQVGFVLSYLGGIAAAWMR